MAQISSYRFEEKTPFFCVRNRTLVPSVVQPAA